MECNLAQQPVSAHCYLTVSLTACPAPKAFVPLPKVIEAWHNLPGTPTLASGTARVVLQLNRFRTVGPVGGVVTKTRTPVQTTC